MDDEAEKATHQPMIGWFREQEQALRHIANAYAASQDDRIHTPEPLAFDAAASELASAARAVRDGRHASSGRYLWRGLEFTIDRVAVEPSRTGTRLHIELKTYANGRWWRDQVPLIEELLVPGEEHGLLRAIRFSAESAGTRADALARLREFATSPRQRRLELDPSGAVRPSGEDGPGVSKPEAGARPCEKKLANQRPAVTWIRPHAPTQPGTGRGRPR